MQIENSDRANTHILQLSADIVTAYVRFNPVPSKSLPDIIQTIHQTLISLGKTQESPQEKQKPAVPIKKSLTHDYIICLEDGKKLKMLKRYLRTQYDMSPEEYRAKWSLPPNYPMVAPGYAERRSQFAKEIGLGRTARKT